MFVCFIQFSLLYVIFVVLLCEQLFCFLIITHSRVKCCFFMFLVKCKWERIIYVASLCNVPHLCTCTLEANKGFDFCEASSFQYACLCLAYNCMIMYHSMHLCYVLQAFPKFENVFIDVYSLCWNGDIFITDMFCFSSFLCV